MTDHITQEGEATATAPFRTTVERFALTDPKRPIEFAWADSPDDEDVCWHYTTEVDPHGIPLTSVITCTVWDAWDHLKLRSADGTVTVIRPQAHSAVKPQTPDLAGKVAGEAYQIIGALASAAGLFDTPEVEAALDHFSGDLTGEILPWSAPKVEQEPVAKVVSAHGDPEAFGEREIEVLKSLSGIPYNTPLYTHPAPAGDEPKVIGMLGHVSHGKSELAGIVAALVSPSTRGPERA